MSQADPSRHIDASLHGSRPKVQETTSPISELQGADAGAMPSRGRRGGVVEKDTDCVKKDPGINAGSPEMGGSRNELEELTQLLRGANAVSEAAADGGPNITVASDSNAAIGAASNPPNAKARHQSLCTHFVRDAVAFRFINLKHVATEKQFAGVFTKPPTAPMLLLLHSMMNGTAAAPLMARLYQ